MLISAFQSREFLVIRTNIGDDDDNPGKTLIPVSPTSPPIILDPAARGSTLGKGIKVLPPK